MVYEGETGQLVTAILRPGNTHAALYAKGVLRRLIRHLKRRFPDLEIVVRRDAGFAIPWLIAELERLKAK